MEYLDIADEAVARTRLTPAPGVTGDLVNLGFQFLGLLETSSGAQRKVSEIYASPDGRSFAEPEGAPGGKELLYFRSILRDGTVVDTAGPPWLPAWLIPPPRRPAPRAGYHLQRLRASTREKYEAHQALLSRVEADRASPVAPADSVPRMAVLSAQSARMIRLNTVVWVVVLVVGYLAGVVGMMFGGHAVILATGGSSDGPPSA